MAVGTRVSLGFLAIFFASVLSGSLDRPAFLWASTQKGCHSKALGRYPTVYEGHMEPESSQGLRGETGPCMKLEGQISVCAYSYEHAHAAVCTWRSENNLQ